MSKTFQQQKIENILIQFDNEELTLQQALEDLDDMMLDEKE